MAATNIPIIVQGNSFNLAIPLQIYVIQDNEMVLQDYTPLPTDDVSIQLKGCRRNYTYTPTIEGNVAKVYLTGNELADNYSIVVSIVKANGERLRSFRTDQFFIVESSDDLTQADIIEGLEDNVIYLQPQYFIAGEDGRGIISVTKTATSGLVDTYTITYTDNTTSTFQVTNGALQPVIVDIEGDVTNAPDEEDLTSVNNGNHDVLKFNDKAYMPTIASGMGRKYLRKNMVNGVNKLTQAMFRDSGNNDLENTIFHIQYDYDLDGATITMPADATLKFEGGKISNGTITFNNTKIDGEKWLDCNIAGTLAGDVIKIGWFAGTFTSAMSRIISYANADNDYIRVEFPKNVRPNDFSLDTSSLPAITANHLSFIGYGNRIVINGLPQSGACFHFNADSIKNGVKFSDLTFYTPTPNVDIPVFLFENYASITFLRCSFLNTGCGIQMGTMGTTNKKAYSLSLPYTSATLANIGCPFVRLVNGAGFTWNTHSGISHMQASVPAEGEEMNTVAGTNAVDIVGTWDSVDLNIFAEKLYRGLNIEPASGTASRGPIYYVKVHDCIFDYIRDRAICVNQENEVANNYLTIENNYIYTWEGDGIYLYAKASHMNYMNIVNNVVYRAGGYGIRTSTLNVDTFKDSRILNNKFYTAYCQLYSFGDRSQITGNIFTGQVFLSTPYRIVFAHNMYKSIDGVANNKLAYDNVRYTDSATTLVNKEIPMASSFPSTAKQGDALYHTTKRRIFTYNGSRWEDQDGRSSGNRYGSTAQRPTSGMDAYDYGFLYYNTEIQQYQSLRLIDNGEYFWENIPSRREDWASSGTTANRPTPSLNTFRGLYYFDTSLKKRIWWDGNKWIEADGATAGVKRNGTTSERPASADIYVGFEYFDTDLGLKVVWNGSAWIVLPKYEVVAALPSSPDSNTLYLIEES